MTGPATIESATLAADEALAARVRARLDVVERRLREEVRTAHPLLAQTSTHLISAGGKRFRPMLTLIAGEFGSAGASKVEDAAVIVELTHLATLYHDDVMDEAPLRRGEVSANARWGNTVAILTGDFLFARASNIAAGLGEAALHIQARTFARAVEGQIAETAGPAEGEDPVEHHLRTVADKTGALIAICAQLGAMLADAPSPVVAAVHRYGEALGIAYQLSDDLIDIASETGQSGKTPGTDLREGVHTLPVLLVLQAARPADARLRELLSRDLTKARLHAEALRLLRAHPAMLEARKRLEDYIGEAKSAASTLPAGPPRDALLALADFVHTRTG
ncbi:MAG TPA: polyprenyl synthetase family protein [Mycobacteriales bacterium]|nr:polyprenyl synthetase family protein [Mycobacteriales bacterium]